MKAWPVQARFVQRFRFRPTVRSPARGFLPEENHHDPHCGLRAHVQREGIREAQAKGKFVGRQPTAQRQAPAIFEAVAAGMEPTEAAKAVGIGRASAFRILKALRQTLQQAVEAGADPREAAEAAGVPWGAAKYVLGPPPPPQGGDNES